MNKEFSKKEAIKFGWKVAKANLSFFIILFIVSMLIINAPNIIKNIIELTKGRIPVLSTITYVVVMILQCIIAIGLVNIVLKLSADTKAGISDLFEKSYLFFKYLFGLIFYTLIILIGTILLIIPGIIWAIKFQFFAYLIIDKNLGLIESFKKSSEITKGVKWNLFIFNILLIGINLLGALALLIGLFVTIPATMIATAYIYRKLLIQTEI